MLENEQQIQHTQCENAMDVQFSKILLKYKNSILSKEERNLRIEIDKVIYVLNRCLAKLEVLAKLPHFLENHAENLLKNLKRHEALITFDVLNSYGAKFQDVECDDLSYREYISSFRGILLDISNKSILKLDTTQSLDPQVYQIIDLLFYNKCVKVAMKSVRNIKVDPTVSKLIRSFREFRNVLKERMYISGDKQVEIDKKLRSAYKSATLQAVVIRELREQLEKQRRELGEQLNNKLEILETNKRRMSRLQYDSLDYFGHELHESEKSMMYVSIKSEQRQAELAEEAKKLKQQYEMLLEEHLNSEKVSRIKRMKIEAQLQNWLQTFDQDIGEKQAEYEVLYKEYTEKKAEVENLQQKIAEQEEEYNILMEEKRIEEERIFNEMASQFLMNRAAKTIQRFWRACWERKQARKKGRKAKPIDSRSRDLIAVLSSDKKIKSHVFEELKHPESDIFTKTE